MGSMPIGDKLRVSEKFKVTEKYKVKPENLPKVKNEMPFDTFIASVIGGVLISQFSNEFSTQIIGYGLTTAGVGLSLLDIKAKYNPYRILFKNMGLEKGGQIPRFKGKRKTSYGYCLEFKMPAGMSSDDFEKRKQAIVEHFNKRIEISYKNFRIFIKVFEKDLESAPGFKVIDTKNKLEFPVGLTYGEEIVTVDLEKVVHLLVASETGGGKSTLLRGIITNLILNNKGVSLYLIDLKNGAEFNVFRKSKKVKSFCRNKGEAEELLSGMINEVDERYDLFYAYDVVNMQEFNKLKGVKKLDYKIIIIDEFADLQNEKGSISAIESLAAKARACGINLIISTQRPDSKIVNGRIKANIPCVIGLKTMNSLNSRIIIDENGLEKLRGKGHAMVRYGNLTEFQAFNISNAEARDLIRHTYILKTKDVTPDDKNGGITDFGFLELIE